MKYIAVDPGKTTGIAVWNGAGFNSFEIGGGLIPATQALRHLVNEGDTVVYEKFEITASTVKKDLTDAYTALYINGNVLTLAAGAGATVREQRPIDKEWGRARNSALLRAAGWHSNDGDGHCNDAAAHLLRYLSNRRLLTDELLSKIIDLELSL